MNINVSSTKSILSCNTTNPATKIETEQTELHPNFFLGATHRGIYSPSQTNIPHRSMLKSILKAVPV